MPGRVLTYTRSKLAAVMSELARIRDSEFPHEHCEYVLDALRDLVRAKEEQLASLTAANAANVILNACEDALTTIWLHLPLLGFVLRSTNVRNAFEMHAPLLRIAQRLIGADVRLVLSSEWEFSPFTYSPTADLPNCVLIGMPASESANGLLVPLAGHELGHTVWQNSNLEMRYSDLISTAIMDAIKERWSEYERLNPGIDQANLSDLEGTSTWTSAYVWAKRQTEETFCDMMGVRIFGEAYLHAFAYLLAPSSLDRSPIYPKMSVRIKNIVDASAAYGIPSPAGYAACFHDAPSQLGKREQYLCEMADAALEEMVPIVRAEANKVVSAAGISVPDSTDVQRALECFEKVVPASGVRSLAAIVNAGWRASGNDKLWSRLPHIRERRVTVLNELVLKSIEISEIEARTVG